MKSNDVIIMATSSTNRALKKRPRDNEDDSKPLCRFGEKCYLNSADHLKEFSHSERSTSEKRRKLVQAQEDDFEKTQIPFYLSTAEGIEDRFNGRNVAFGITDILDIDSDRLIQSCQFNYMIDIKWLVSKYPICTRGKPLLIVHGSEGKEQLDLQSEAMQFKHINLVKAKLPIPYGTHHTKMMFLLYNHGIRIVIHTANLIEQDWKQKTQGIWISPLFHKMSQSYKEEDDDFKQDLIDYVNAYGSAKLSKWVEIIKLHDMTSAGARIVGSVPGRHSGQSLTKWGHLRLKKLLSSYGPLRSKVSSDWSVIGQFSSIGSLGTEPTKWLTSEWLTSLSQCRKEGGSGEVGKADLKLIFPTMENVRHSLEGYSAGGSLPFSVENAMKQRWMRQFLCQWKSNLIGRSLASPHIKTYTRVSPQNDKVAWFLVSSANLSRAAWGSLEKNGTQLMIRSYEIGVLITPQIMNCKGDFLDISTNRKGNDLRLPYDIPVTQYRSEDKPWVWNIRYTKEDSHGKLWNPSF